jgi:methionyl-tRNA formyltransferase
MTAGELHDRLATLRAHDLMGRALAALDRGSKRLLSCAAGRTMASLTPTKIEKSESRIDWALPAQEVHNRTRGLSPFPGAWFEVDFGKGPERIKALRSQLAKGAGSPGEILACASELVIACGEDAVRLTEVQRAGKTPVSADDFLRGANLSPGMKAL